MSTGKREATKFKEMMTTMSIGYGGEWKKRE
jgi:hypothetical protein